ncbi:hypothetical protein CALCODRAFT_487763 [Calocera cornea HHB12733]|uniref:Uncharacterized protein n=1 Tax=Calocera cornea HHB12733 TaxID=1353952 RepID=A0A165CXS7_9BASI|nr:hypothetical protein CALCODRAFT_487763 [Calocera cornea HHB12733]
MATHPGQSRVSRKRVRPRRVFDPFLAPPRLRARRADTTAAPPLAGRTVPIPSGVHMQTPPLSLSCSPPSLPSTLTTALLPSLPAQRMWDDDWRRSRLLTSISTSPGSTSSGGCTGLRNANSPSHAAANIRPAARPGEGWLDEQGIPPAPATRAVGGWVVACSAHSLLEPTVGTVDWQLGQGGGVGARCPPYTLVVLCAAHLSSLLDALYPASVATTRPHRRETGSCAPRPLHPLSSASHGHRQLKEVGYHEASRAPMLGGCLAHIMSKEPLAAGNITHEVLFKDGKRLPAVNVTDLWPAPNISEAALDTTYSQSHPDAVE